MTISSEDVRNGYLFILGREPESEAAVAAHSRQPDILKFREGLLRSEEFRTKYMSLLTPVNSRLNVLWNRQTLAFVHAPKTGGTTLHNLLSACFPSDQICPERRDKLYFYSPSQLADYDFYSGHFSHFSVRFIPRQRVRIVSIFRDPSRRLISYYRFCRAHPATREFARDIFIKLANTLGPEEFFEHEYVRQSSLNNSYVLQFGSCLGYPEATADDSVASGMITCAKEAVARLDAIGITEKFAESVGCIFSTLGLPIPHTIEPAQVTDELPNLNERLSRVPEVNQTARLARALEPLIRHDREIYELAREEFERRLALGA